MTRQYLGRGPCAPAPQNGPLTSFTGCKVPPGRRQRGRGEGGGGGEGSHKPYLSGTFRRCQHGAFSHFFRLFSTFGLMPQSVVTLGGGGMCMLFEICEKTPFQNCMGWGGIGDHIFEYRGQTFWRFRVFGPQAAPLTRACRTPTHRFSPRCSDILWSWSKVKGVNGCILTC